MVINILHGRPLPVYGDGLNIRDWLFVDDHNRAIDRIVRDGAAGEVYNVGGLNEWANIDIVRLLCRLLDEAFQVRSELEAMFPDSPAARGDSEGLIAFVADRPGHDRRYAIDAGKIQATLGFVPQESFESGIRKTVDWYLDNPSWWKSVMDGSYRQWIQKNYEDR
jgi:dTDP-glucose 4,6-dehydratase